MAAQPGSADPGAEQQTTQHGSDAGAGNAWQQLFPWLLLLLAAFCVFTDAASFALVLCAGAIVAALQASNRHRHSG